MITHIQICTENQTGNEPIIYDGEFDDSDFINRDVIIGELVKNMLKTAHECEVTRENLDISADKGKKIIIKYWKENRKSIT